MPKRRLLRFASFSLFGLDRKILIYKRQILMRIFICLIFFDILYMYFYNIFCEIIFDGIYSQFLIVLMYIILCICYVYFYILCYMFDKEAMGGFLLIYIRGTQYPRTYKYNICAPSFNIYIQVYMLYIKILTLASELCYFNNRNIFLLILEFIILENLIKT